MLRKIYEKRLQNTVMKPGRAIPEHVALVLAETDILSRNGVSKLRDFVNWSSKLGVTEISTYIDVLDIEPQLQEEMAGKLAETLRQMFAGMSLKTEYAIYNDKGTLVAKNGNEKPLINILVGFGGKRELTHAVRAILKKVEVGELQPDEITEKSIEDNLTIRTEPDLIIRAGGKHLSDFLIWQSVYAELFFTDVNWESLRKIDLLRIMRDFQNRQRRYGK
ncbi:undecaprenyl diphosphate synthase [Methanohalophilus levihalophilus]|uniref:undecaprenyl diphosphate synthase family protein n=1 Tax=Methanohalophilus levihalophilus TaxID=1431282 RepID=UPI001AE6CB21|nr:undecaprenyl diphosphate synthase family protein [Methanohalophilus levihalophilus]MBP2030053.1 undecaprenyl diphosphate synthase [Methanohalophilus levihalophilus]